MRTIFFFFLVAVLVLAFCLSLSEANTSTAPQLPPKLQEVNSFAFAIGNKTITGSKEEVANRYQNFDLVIVDGQEISKEKVAAMHQEGVLVLGYLSVGTIEKWRPWYKNLKPYRLEAWQDWQDEYYADTSKSRYRQIISNDIAPQILSKNLDGLFLDNVDMIENHKPQKKGMYALVRSLADKEGYLFVQNGYSILNPIMGSIDGWNREDTTSTYNFDTKKYKLLSKQNQLQSQKELRQVKENGVLTLSTDYTASNSNQAARLSRRNACFVGALPYISNIGLSRISRAIC